MTDIEKITIDALAANNVPVAKIAEQVGISRNTIKSYLQRKKSGRCMFELRCCFETLSSS